MGDLLPRETLAFYLHTAERAATLMPLIKRSHEAACYVDSIILDHGLVQFALRGLFVMAWQRAVMPSPLTSEQLAPYYNQRSRRGDVHSLIVTLERHQLLQAHQAREFQMVNDVRNRAAHGVIFGEIKHADLAASSLNCLYAAGRALDLFGNWFKNPRPLKEAI